MCLPGTSLLKTLVCKKWWFSMSQHVWYTHHPVQSSSISPFTIENSSFFLIWVCIGCITVSVFFSFIQESRGYFFFFWSLDSFASSMVLSCIRNRASSFPRRLPNTHQSLIGESMNTCWSKRSGFESKFHLRSFLRKIILIMYIKIWHNADVQQLLFPFHLFPMSHIISNLYF